MKKFLPSNSVGVEGKINFSTTKKSTKKKVLNYIQKKTDSVNINERKYLKLYILIKLYRKFTIFKVKSMIIKKLLIDTNTHTIIDLIIKISHFVDKK